MKFSQNAELDGIDSIYDCANHHQQAKGLASSPLAYASTTARITTYNPATQMNAPANIVNIAKLD